MMLRIAVIFTCLVVSYARPGNPFGVTEVFNSPQMNHPLSRRFEDLKSSPAFQVAQADMSQLLSSVAGFVSEIVERVPKVGDGKPLEALKQIVNGQEVTLAGEKDNKGLAKYTMTITPAKEGKEAKSAKQTAAAEAAPKHAEPAAPKAAEKAPAAPAPHPEPEPEPEPEPILKIRRLKAQLEREFQTKMMELDFKLEQAEHQMEYEKEQREIAAKTRLETVLRQLESEIQQPLRISPERFSATDLALDGDSERVFTPKRGILSNPAPAIIPGRGHFYHSRESREHLDSKEHYLVHTKEGYEIKTAPRSRIAGQRRRPVRVHLASQEHDSHEHYIRNQNMNGKNPIRYDLHSREHDSHEHYRRGGLAHIRDHDHHDTSESEEHFRQQLALRMAQIKRTSEALAVEKKAEALKMAEEKVVEAPLAKLTMAEKPAEEKPVEAKPETKAEEALPHIDSTVVKMNPNHELYSEEDEGEELDYGFGPIYHESNPQFFLFKQNIRPENFQGDWAENKIDSGMIDDGFAKEWREAAYDSFPRDMSSDVRVNRIFRTRNANFFNPDAEMIPVEPNNRPVIHERRTPIKK